MQQVLIYLVIIWPTNTVAFKSTFCCKILFPLINVVEDPDTEIESELV